MTLNKNLQLIVTGFLLTLLLLMVWYMVSNPPPMVPLHPATKTVEATAELLTELTETIRDIGIEEEISKELPLERLRKLEAELAGILSKTLTRKTCVQYALLATKEDWYPCYRNSQSMIYLNIGEVWKYGKTCIGEEKRYGNLRAKNLAFNQEFTGTEIQCLIVEKIKIYNYIVYPENIRRAYKTGNPPLLRPPGNKIDR